MKTQFKRGFSWRDETGYYPTPSGGKYPSVTTVLGPHDDFLWVHLKKINSLVDVLSEKCGIRFVENAELYFTELFLPSLKSFNAAKALAMPEKQALWYAKKG